MPERNALFSRGNIRGGGCLRTDSIAVDQADVGFVASIFVSVGMARWRAKSRPP
jgi:hypothetical protein